MTPNLFSHQIREMRKLLDAKFANAKRKYESELEWYRMQERQLMVTCPHNLERIRDPAGGPGEWHCPDCGWYGRLPKGGKRE